MNCSNVFCRTAQCFLFVVRDDRVAVGVTFLDVFDDMEHSFFECKCHDLFAAFLSSWTFAPGHEWKEQQQ